MNEDDFLAARDIMQAAVARAKQIMCVVGDEEAIIYLTYCLDCLEGFQTGRQVEATPRYKRVLID